jgi:trimeric autotransporter adhesin
VPLTIEAVVATAIEINNETIAKKDGAKVTFKVANQYGTDMKIGANDADLSVQAYNVTQKKALTVDTTSANSEFTLDLALDTNAKLDDEIRLIVTYKGITVTKTLKVVEAEAVADIELGTAELPKDAKRFTVNTADIKLPYTLKDQYGKELKLTANQTGATAISSVDGITFLSSDSAIVDPASFSTDADGNLTFDLGPKAGTVTITAVINSTGDVATTTLKVEEAPKVNAVSISAPTTLVAGGEKAVLDLVVTDQYGDLIKNDDAKVAALTYKSSDQTIVQDANIKLVNGKLEVTTEATGKGSVTISVMSGTTEVGKVTFNVEEKAVATSIVGVETATLFEDGATSTLTFKDIKVKDQYGRDYTLTTGDTVTVGHKDTTPDNVTFAIDGNTDNVLEDGETLTFTGTSSTNNEVITFKLANGASYDLTVASIASEDITSYSIKPVDTIYAQSVVDPKYDVQLELVGKTSAGKEVVLKPGKVTNATTSDASVATVTSGGVVTGKAKGTATIALWNGATKLAETTVTVSDATPVATKVEFVDLPANVNDTDDLTSYVQITDQYGVDITASELPNGFWTTSDANIATFTGGTVTKVAVGKVTVGFVTSNGLVVTKEVNVN